MAELNWGRVVPTLTAFYGLKPWEIERLTEEQVQMYMEGMGYVRFLRDLPMLQYQFSKLDDEAVGKLIAEADKPADPNSLRARGWRIFVRNYGAMDEEAEDALEASPLAGLSPEGAAAIVQWVESQEMSNQPNGAMIWRLRLMNLWAGLKATARG